QLTSQPVTDELRAVLTAALADPDGLVRRRAVQALGLLPPAEAVSPLAGMLIRDASWPVREAAAQALAGFAGDEFARINLARAALRDRQALVRAAAVAGLAGVGEPARTVLLAELRSALREPRFVRRRRAVAVLARLREPAAKVV